MLRKHFASVASAILLAGGLGLGVASGSPATAATTGVLTGSFNGTCYVWTDGITFGTDCTNVNGEVYGATGFCRNGQIAYGPLKTSGWSYAYCSTYNSQLNTALTTIVNGGNPILHGRAPVRPAMSTHQSRQLNIIKATARSASDSGHCSVWTDGNTFGTACAWNRGLFFTAYRALATCSNNAGASGPVVSGGWSYAYCSTYHAKAIGGGINF